MTVPSGLAPYVPRIDPGRYDRAPTLTYAERQALAAWNSRRGYHSLQTSLARLCRPLADVFSPVQRNRHGVKRTFTFVLEEVRRTGVPYWAWTERHWLDLLNGPDADASSSRMARPYLLASAYLLTGFARAHDIEQNPFLAVAARIVFGSDRFEGEYVRLEGTLARLGYARTSLRNHLPVVLAALMLERRDPRLEAFDAVLLERTRALHGDLIAKNVGKVSHGLAALGVLATPLRMRGYVGWREKGVEGVGQEWAAWCRRWRETSTLRPRTRETNYSFMLRTGLWLAKAHPEVTSPAQWAVEVCADFLAAVDRLTVGEWVLSSSSHVRQRNAGKPMDANFKRVIYHAIRRFLGDVQLWGWATLRCNPRYHLATPTSVLRLAGVNPRTIDDAVWLKLVWASLNLEKGDRFTEIHYPIELLRAVAVVWTHAGLRGNEILRLRQGCARPQDDAVVDEAGGVTPAGTLCYLDVPAGKTSRAHTKPVALVVKERIDAWAAVRPEQGTVEDEVTGEHVHMLFQLRGRPPGKTILNRTIIPMLCAKAGLPLWDTMGAITSHRGRASTVTVLASVPQGMTLPELMAWCGHSNPKSTMHYIRVRPTRLAGAFAKADQMAHMVRVLIDQEAVLSGAARDGAPWKFYDLGHSYCTNAFWSTCPHRMACAGCSFNLPKSSAKGMVVEARASVTRLLEEVPLSPDERAAAEGDVTALDGMLAKLQDVPALDGRTPQEIHFADDCLAS